VFDNGGFITFTEKVGVVKPEYYIWTRLSPLYDFFCVQNKSLYFQDVARRTVTPSPSREGHLIGRMLLNVANQSITINQ
jgi:hypothetical protein